MSLNAAFATIVLGCTLLLGTAPAFAQHVVTDVEAGKLTFDALTATPRPVYRPVMAVRRLHRSGGISRVVYRRRTGSHSSWR